MSRLQSEAIDSPVLVSNLNDIQPRDAMRATMFDEWTNQDFSGLSSEAMVWDPKWHGREDNGTTGPGTRAAELPMPDASREAQPNVDAGFIIYDDFFDMAVKASASGPVYTEEGPDDDLPDGGTLDDIIVTGVRPPPANGAPGIVVIQPSGEVEETRFNGGSEITRGLCELSNLVRSLDGNFFGETDGDGIDELLNILTVASFALGLGGIGALAARLAAGALNSTAFLGAVSFMFGDEIALRISYIAFGRVAVAGAASAVVTDSFKDLLEALTNGNPPPTCPG